MRSERNVVVAYTGSPTIGVKREAEAPCSRSECTDVSDELPRSLPREESCRLASNAKTVGGYDQSEVESLDSPTSSRSGVWASS